jgi:hypothetical protein
VADVVEEPGNEDEAASGDDPGEQPGRLDHPDGERQQDAGEKACGDSDAAEERRDVVVPAGTRRHRDEPAAERGGAQQRPEDDRGDRQRGERDGRFHGR